MCRGGSRAGVRSRPPKVLYTPLRPDLLNVLLLEPSGSKFFHVRKKTKQTFVHVIVLIYTRMGFVTNGSFVAQRGSRFRLHCATRVQNH